MGDSNNGRHLTFQQGGPQQYSQYPNPPYPPGGVLQFYQDAHNIYNPVTQAQYPQQQPFIYNGATPHQESPFHYYNAHYSQQLHNPQQLHPQQIQQLQSFSVPVPQNVGYPTPAYPPSAYTHQPTQPQQFPPTLWRVADQQQHFQPPIHQTQPTVSTTTTKKTRNILPITDPKTGCLILGGGGDSNEISENQKSDLKPIITDVVEVKDENPATVVEPTIVAEAELKLPEVVETIITNNHEDKIIVDEIEKNEDSDVISLQSSVVKSDTEELFVEQETVTTVGLKRPFRYDKATLIEMKGHPDSLIRPLNLPEIAGVTLTQIRNFEEWEINSDALLSKHFASRSSSSSTMQSNRGYQRNQPKNKPSFQHQTRGYNTPPVRSLKESANSYKPAFKMTGDKIEIDVLRREIISYLNKLTPENFDKMVGRIMNLGLHTVDDLTMLCETIFHKATKEKTYTATFAKLCAILADKISVIDKDSDKAIKFKGPVIRYCQTLFEMTLEEYMKREEERLDEEINEETDEQSKTLLMNNKQDRLKSKIEQYYGNMRFIAELIRHRVLSPKIFFHCSDQLAKNTSNLSLDCLCELYATVGDLLDIPAYNDNLQKVFKYMKDESLDKNIETRIRFKLQDLIERRERGWKKRDIQEQLSSGPKPLNEIRAQSEKKEFFHQPPPHYQKHTPKVGGTGMIFSRTPYHVTSDSFRKSSFDSSSNIQTFATTTSFFGPNSNAGWAMGSGTASRASSTTKKRSDDYQQRPPRSSNRQDSPVTVSNRFVTKDNKSATDSGRSTPLLSGSQTSLANVESPVLLLDSDAIERKAKWALEEYALTNDFDRSNYLLHSDNHAAFVEFIISCALEEKKEFPRFKVGEFLSRLEKENLLSMDTIVDGFNSIFINSEDLIPDYPEFWIYMANMLEGFFTDENTNVTFLNKLNLSHDKKGFDKLLPLLFKGAIERLGQPMVAQIVDASQLSQSLSTDKYFSTTAIATTPTNASSTIITNVFANATAAASVIPSTTVTTTQNACYNYDELLKELIQLEDNEKIFEFIDQGSQDILKDIEFVKSIAYFTLKTSVVNGKYQSGTFQEKLPVLKKYASHLQSDTPPLIEKALLYALQRLEVSDFKVKIIILDDLESRKLVSSPAAASFKNHIENVPPPP